MRLAILSDIHGNPIALDAVLEDIQRAGGVDGYWVLGDLAAIGPDPIGALERIYALPDAQITRGNTDRYLVTEDRPLPPLNAIAQNHALWPRFSQVLQSFAWTMGALAYTDWLEKIAALPLDVRLTLPDGTRVLGVHAAPGTDDGDGIHPLLSAAELRALVADCSADLVFVGHTHYPLDETVDKTRIVNLGSVSNPTIPDLRAKYTLLESDARGYRVDHRRVEFDREAVVEQLRRVHHPAQEFIIRHMRGQQKPAFSASLSAQRAHELGLPEVLAGAPA
jgi:predicted phosphodiesterase